MAGVALATPAAALSRTTTDCGKTASSYDAQLVVTQDLFGPGSIVAGPAARWPLADERAEDYVGSQTLSVPGHIGPVVKVRELIAGGAITTTDAGAYSRVGEVSADLRHVHPALDVQLHAEGVRATAATRCGGSTVLDSDVAQGRLVVAGRQVLLDDEVPPGAGQVFTLGDLRVVVVKDEQVSGRVSALHVRVQDLVARLTADLVIASATAR